MQQIEDTALDTVLIVIIGFLTKYLSPAKKLLLIWPLKLIYFVWLDEDDASFV